MSNSLNDKIVASSYLSRLAAKTSIDGALSLDHLLTSLQECCDRVEQFELSESLDQASEFLIKLKQEFVMLWAQGALRGQLDQQTLGHWQSKFADHTIDFALAYGWQMVAKKHPVLRPVLLESEKHIPGLFILGMGKLGGRDLNFSSDVDLVAYFDPAVLAVPSA